MSNELLMLGFLVKFAAFNFALFNDVKVFSYFILCDYDFIFLKVLNSDSIEQSDLLVSIEIVQKGHLVEEPQLRAFVSDVLCIDDLFENWPTHHPHSTISHRCDCC